MKNPNVIASGIGHMPTDFIIDCLMALGLDHALFLIVNIHGICALMIDENITIEEHKLYMIRVTLDAN